MHFEWLISDLFASLGFVLALFLLAHLLKQRRSPVSTMAWLLTIVLLPYLGVPLYVMFGGRKMSRMAGKKERVYAPPLDRPGPGRDGVIERVLQSYGVPPATRGNAVELVSRGEDAYRKIIELIDSAQHTVHITTYILGRDPVGEAIVDHLAAKAADGVEVRLLLDAVGSWRMNRRWLEPLTAAGGRVAYFMPLIRLPFRGRANLRNHRKTVVIDGRSALVGGMNLAREYLGPSPDPNRWRDLVVQVSGPVVRDLDDVFRSDWRFATHEDLSPMARADAPDEADGLLTAQAVASGPDVVGDPFYESLVSALFAARRRVWVVTPYFIPDETLVRALDLAARRGVDVRLVVPSRSNHLIADLARGSYLHEVHDSGGTILMFTPGMVHAKAILIDDDLAIIGTANMDMRSLFLNYEVSLFFYSRPLTEQTACWMTELMSDCRPYRVTKSSAKILIHDVFRLLSPLL